MQINWFSISLLVFGFYCQPYQAFNIKNIKNILKRQNDQDFKMVKMPQQIYYYYEDWSCGEVEWEFAEKNSVNTYKIVVPEKTYIVKTEPTNINTIKECKKPLAIKNGIVKVLYNDIVRAENLIFQMQNIDYSNYLSEGSLTEAISLSFIGIISYIYKKSVKNEMNILRKQKRELSHKKLTLQEIDDYLKFQKLVKTFMIVFLFIFTKNVKNAE